MYEQDSLFTLSPAAQAGVLAITLTLSVALLWLTYRLARRRALLIRLATAAVLFALFVWLSPQIYYTYYLQIFDGLPVQWVVKWPDPGRLIRLITFQDQVSLSDHGKGVLFWAMTLVSLAAPRLTWR